MKIRLLGGLLLAAAAVVGARTFTSRTRWAPRLGAALERDALQKRFGPDVTVGSFRLLAAGRVDVDDVRAPRQGALEAGASPDQARAEGLWLPTVRIHLDPLDLLAGRIVTRRLDVEGGRFPLRETDGAMAPDFMVIPPDPDDAPAPVPYVLVRNALVEVRGGGADSSFAPGARFDADLTRLEVLPRPQEGRMSVTGRLTPRLADAPDARIVLEGDVDPETGAFEATARWDPLHLTPDLLDLLAPDLARPLRQDSIQEGSLVVELRRGTEPDEPVRVKTSWSGAVDVAADDLPGTVYFDARSRQQLADLFGRGVLSIEVEGGRVGIDRLFTELAGGEVSATGWIEHETGALELDFRIRRLALDDPALREALSEEGRALYDQFAPSGYVDAVGRVTRAPGGEVDWYVDVLLEAASFRYFGAPEAGGIRDGFPYPILDATGRIRITPGGVWFDEVVGFNRGAEVRILGQRDRTWTDGPRGTETGRVLFGQGGPDVRMSIVVQDLPMDDQVAEAIQGSTFADLMEEFELTGTLDRVELDILAYPDIDTSAKTELRITLEGEQFRYRPFPLPLEDVRGTIILRRPLRDDGSRGRTYAFDIEGWADGARIAVQGDIDDTARTGRLHLRAEGIGLEGRVGEVVVASELTGEMLGPLWRWLAPSGRADLVADLPLSDDPGPPRFQATLKGARLGLDSEGNASPVVLDALRGLLAVEGGRVTFEGLHGELAGRPVTLSGRMDGGPSGTWTLDARAPEVEVTAELLAGVRHLMDGESLLPDGLEPEPGTRLGLELALAREAGGPLATTATVRDVRGEVRLRDGSRARVTAERVVVGPERIESAGLRVEREGLAIEVGSLSARTGGASSVHVEGRVTVRLDRHRPAADELALLPDAARRFLESWAGDRTLSSEGLTVEALPAGGVLLGGAITFHPPEGPGVRDGPAGRVAFAPLRVDAPDEGPTRLEGALEFLGFTPSTGGPVRDLTGRLLVHGVELGRVPGGRGRIEGLSGRLGGLAFAGLAADLELQEQVLIVPRATAQLAGGTVTLDCRLHLGRPAAHEGHASLRGVDLAGVLSALGVQDARYRGELGADLTWASATGDLADAVAVGALRIRRGWLGEMPSARSWSALLGSLGGGSEEPFREAYAAFRLQEGRVQLPSVALAGRGLLLPGRGWVTLDGDVDLVFTPDIVKNLLLPGSMEVPGLAATLRRLLPEAGLYHVRLRGRIGEAESELVSAFDGPGR